MRTAIIVDIDGTLAKMNGRGPFDWDRVGEDKVNEPIRTLVNLYHMAGRHIIIFSGRDGCCKPQTTSWLVLNRIPFHDLYMREEGNNEKDAIIKRRLFDTHVKDNFIVEVVIDDRDQVVKMWREDLGLTCLQVAYGNF